MSLAKIAEYIGTTVGIIFFLLLIYAIFEGGNSSGGSRRRRSSYSSGGSYTRKSSTKSTSSQNSKTKATPQPIIQTEQKQTIPANSHNGAAKIPPPLPSPPVIKNLIRQQPILLGDLVDKNNVWINREIETATRLSQPETEVVFLHRRMQKELTYCLLKTNAPGRSVYNEFRCIDILIEDTSRFTLIEIKTSLSAMANIREAIGQLLEYQFMSRLELKEKRNSLLIISPAKLTEEVCNYVNHLGSLYSIEVDYRQYVPGSFFFTL